MLDVNDSWPLQGKMWDPYFFFTSCIPSHRFGPTLSSLTPCSSLGLSFVNSCLAFQLRSAVTLYLTRTDSQREEREPLSSLIPLISQPTISSPGWVLFTCRFSILSLYFPSWHPLSLPFAPWHSVFPAQSYVCLYSSLINVWNGCLPLSALESSSLCEYAPTVKGNSFYPWDSLSEKLKVFLGHVLWLSFNPNQLRRATPFVSFLITQPSALSENRYKKMSLGQYPLKDGWATLALEIYFPVELSSNPHHKSPACVFLLILTDLIGHGNHSADYLQQTLIPNPSP